MDRFVLKKPSFYEMASLQGLWQQHPDYSGVVGHWLLNEGGGLTAYDSSVYRNDGTLSGMDQATDWIVEDGSHGHALDFDGTNDVIIVSDNAIHEFSADFTMSFWVNPVSQNSRMIGKGSTGSFYFFEIITGGRYRSQINDGSSLSSITGVTNDMPAGAWSHVAVVLESGVAHRVYIDGVEVGTDTTSIPTGAGANSNDFEIGATATQYAQCKISNVMLFNRALTASDVALYASEPYFMFEWARIQKRAKFFLIPSGGDATKSVSDSGSGSDSPGIQASATLAEIASAAELASLSALATLIDSGSGLGAPGIAVSGSVTDVGAGDENIPISASVSPSDSGSGSELLPISVSFTLADTGSGSDTPTVSADNITKTVTDTLTGLDVVSSVSVDTSVADVGAGAVSVTVAANVSLADAGQGLDVVITAVAATILDASSAVDSVTLTATVPVSELGAAIEAIANGVSLSVSDVSVAVDTATGAEQSTTRIAKVTLTLGRL